MIAPPTAAKILDASESRVRRHGVPWATLEDILAERGNDCPGSRLVYLSGELEIMTPSFDHEFVKTTIGRLVEAYADERGISLNGVGSWTVKSRAAGRAAEADECFLLGPRAGRDRPDLAIEVVWSRGGIDRLDVWRGLGVEEVWLWIDGAIHVHVLVGAQYEPCERSRLLPGLDLALVARLSVSDEPSAAVREFRAVLRMGQAP